MFVRVLPLVAAALVAAVPVTASAQLRARLLASGFDRPNSVVVDPFVPGAVYVVDQIGKIRTFFNGVERATPFLDISSLVSGGYDERGLLSMAIPPDGATTGRVFINFTNRTGAGNTVIRRYTRSAADPMVANPASAFDLQFPAMGGGRQGFIVQDFQNHNGGNLVFGPDGYLYIGMGDGGSGGDPQLNGQRNDSLLGKMLRIDVDTQSNVAPFYTIPADNPTFGGTRNEIWAKGLRNPWRFSFDRLTGNLFIGDVGQDSREEINFQARASRGGENYGWNVMEGTACFSNAAVSIGAPPCNDLSYTRPIVEYSHASGHCSVTGGYVYRGTKITGLNAAYVYGDFCSGTIWAARLTNNVWTVEELPIRASNLSTFGEDSNGEFYLATLDGTLSQFVVMR